MKKALIIGAGGFVGSYLINCLHHEFHMEVHATKLNGTTFSHPSARIYDLDILDREAVRKLLDKIRPDYIFHLAAQSSVSAAWKDPMLTIDVNIKGSVNVMDAVRELPYKPRILIIGSGEEYGHIRDGQTPISEETMLRPGNLYAATKACQNMIGSIYAKAYGMEIILVRAFNHVGPGQAPIFVVSDFCKQTAEIEMGLREPLIRVGNLSARRDFTDVRDVVRAYGLLSLKGTAGETYNVGSGTAIKIRQILDLIVGMSSAKIGVEVDPAKIRPVDVPVIEADIIKITKATGWKPVISIEQTIKETLDYWRKR
ncbi:MAG: GDP-mannose 4,6-dehydratase [Hungatella sp.]|nr:GDP-mannose 4,6-dehydratase [Hungatella sp.]